MTETSPVTIVTFVLYVAGTFVLAVLSHRLLGGRGFLGEYFLGSRELRSWSLAFAFAATATSAGSFIGFPALIYSYGWILALWIASYMIYPLCAMGVLGKRLNQVARKTQAITIPDVLRDRFESPALGLFLTSTILLFTTCNLVAQFRAGAIILEGTFNFPAGWGYTAGLLIFAGVVVLYTTYGGFRAVVWTDVMQGLVMGVGIVILLPIVIWRVGGLDGLVDRLAARPPQLVTALPGEHNDLAFLLKETGPAPSLSGVQYEVRSGVLGVSARRVPGHPDSGDTLVVEVPAPADGVTPATAADVRDFLNSHPEFRRLVAVEFAYGNDGGGSVGSMPWTAFVAGGEFVFGPGRRPDGLPFHPLGLAISYYLMWAITAMGQPGMMVRLMAFKDSRTLKRAIIIVTFYFSLIYIPLVFIFTSAPLLLPHLSPEDADRAMVLVAARVVGTLGLGYALLAAVLIAAPFAAVMSTVDSFLLMISSSIVQDVYQRTIDPLVGERRVRRMSYATTFLVGGLVTVLATRTIDFLQYIVVFTSSGFACAFLAPVSLGIYWPRMTRQGALWSAAGGLATVLLLFSPVPLGGIRVDLLGLHPVIWGLAASFLLGVGVSLWTGPPPEHLVRRYFSAR